MNQTQPKSGKTSFFFCPQNIPKYSVWFFDWTSTSPPPHRLSMVRFPVLYQYHFNEQVCQVCGRGRRSLLCSFFLLFTIHEIVPKKKKKNSYKNIAQWQEVNCRWWVLGPVRNTHWSALRRWHHLWFVKENIQFGTTSSFTGDKCSVKELHWTVHIIKKNL